jgi:hypothetical protein
MKSWSRADVVVSLACNLSSLPPRRDTIRRWDDAPPPSEDLRVDETIRRHVMER